MKVSYKCSDDAHLTRFVGRGTSATTKKKKRLFWHEDLARENRYQYHTSLS